MKGKRNAVITERTLSMFRNFLVENEKAPATIKKYVRELERLQSFLHGRGLCRELLLEYRSGLGQCCSALTVNNRLSAVNAYLAFAGITECRIRFLKVQRKAFLEENRELTEQEYRRLLLASQKRKNKRLDHLMLTVCSTGIRVSELRFITVEAVKKGKAEICMKGKNRTVILSKELRKKLQNYIRTEQIREGILFRTRTGRPLDRSNIWRDMKKLCETAGVDKNKVFPHSLRHLFARSYYSMEKDLAHLADILGHSSVETTRIYVAESTEAYEKILRKMKLII